MKDLLIKGGRIIDPSQNMDEVSDILLADGCIKKLAKEISAAQNYEIIDARGRVLCPGFIDLHCHLRQPGYENKETIASGAHAAARGGFTTICCMPNTNPPLDNKILVYYVKLIAEKEAMVRVLPIGCISRGRKGEELADMAEMAEAGVAGFSDDGSPLKSTHLMCQALEYSCSLDLPVIDHCEDAELADGGQMNEGIIATRLGLQGIPVAAEEIAVARDVILAEKTGSHIHIAHTSTKGSVEIIRQAKKRGVKVTAEVTPHHLTMTEERVLGYDTNAKVSPPLRTQPDIDALIDGLKDHTIDIIATDHAPHTENDKLCEFALAASGISGLETALGSLMGLVHSGRLSLDLLIAKLSSTPSRMLRGRFGKLGTLDVGAMADITIFDPDLEWRVDVTKFASRGRNTPLNGEKLKGKVLMTIYGGKVVYRDEGFDT
jgi:dihydroorotase